MVTKVNAGHAGRDFAESPRTGRGQHQPHVPTWRPGILCGCLCAVSPLRHAVLQPPHRRLQDHVRVEVGATGFEPATPCTPYRCATKLRHAPVSSIIGYPVPMVNLLCAILAWRGNNDGGVSNRARLDGGDA